MTSAKKAPKKQNRKNRKDLRFSKVVIIMVLLSVALFTATMTAVYCTMGGVPDTLITAFFAFCGGEAGVLGFLKWVEEKTDKKKKAETTETDGQAVG